MCGLFRARGLRNMRLCYFLVKTLQPKQSLPIASTDQASSEVMVIRESTLPLTFNLPSSSTTSSASLLVQYVEQTFQSCHRPDLPLCLYSHFIEIS
jgi:hypothetical protein